MSSEKATSPKARGQETAATLSAPVSQSSAWFRAKGVKQRKGQKVPLSHALYSATQSEDVVVAGSEG